MIRFRSPAQLIQLHARRRRLASAKRWSEPVADILHGMNQWGFHGSAAEPIQCRFPHRMFKKYPEQDHAKGWTEFVEFVRNTWGRVGWVVETFDVPAEQGCEWYGLRMRAQEKSILPDYGLSWETYRSILRDHYEDRL